MDGQTNVNFKQNAYRQSTVELQTSTTGYPVARRHISEERVRLLQRNNRFSLSILAIL